MKAKKVLIMDNFVHGHYGGGQVFSDWLFDQLGRIDHLQVSKLDLNSIRDSSVNAFFSAIETGFSQISKKLVGLPLLRVVTSVTMGFVETGRLKLQSKLMFGEKYDVVISNDFRDLWIIDKAGMSFDRLMVVLHNPELKSYLTERGKRDFMQKIFNTSYYLRKHSKSQTTVFIALNSNQEALVKSRLSGSVITIPLGINVDKYVPAPLAPFPKTCLFVGRLFEKQKRLSVLISMFAKSSAPDWYFYIVGDGPDKEVYQELIRSLGAEHRVIITGFVTEDEKIEFLQRGRVFLSASRNEGLPFSYLEALSCGLPIISYRNIGSESLIAEGINGFLVDDENSMMERVRELMNNDDLSLRMSENARDSVVSKYDQEEVLKQYVSLIENS